MLSLPPTVRILLATAPTDMRLGFDGLAARVRHALGEDPRSGHLFVFLGKRADRVKILWWDLGGMALYAKRLERGTFRRARGDAARVSLTPAELAMLLEGIDLAGTRRRPRLMANSVNT
ncbi:MAG TPA: IS66 family insertion sequence element accessory protein TnpB [Burkholderiaceae bacterium]|nr:IS66 family insertion sequence element accessory protein TnpB [Burkholderiaceae bacterium]